MNKKLVLLLAMLCTVAGCTPSLRHIELSVPPLKHDPASRGHVLVIPGVYDDCSFQEYCTSSLVDLIEADPQLSAEFLPWYDWGGYDILQSRNEQTLLNRRRAQILAKRISEWVAVHHDKSLYVVAGSGGGFLLSATCSSGLLPQKPFNRVILASTALGSASTTHQITSNCKAGLFSYWSEKDQTLPKFGLANAAGKKGFVRSQHLTDLKELKYRADHRSLGNDGDHCGCFASAFATKYFLPLMREDSPTVLAEWK